jgi:anaerobic dimethyl sulfoxide reductase subunit C
MEMREWALISFTILAQMAVGSFLVLGVVHFFTARQSGAAQADRLSDRALIGVVVVLLLGLGASLLHLGNPLNAYKTITNVGSSWLSREILCGTAFAVVGGLFAVMQWRKLGTPGVRNVVAWLAAAIGAVMVYVMAMIYMLPTRPSWNVVTTPVSFYVTTLLLGVMAMGAAFVANYAYLKRSEPKCADEQCQLLRQVLRWLSLAAIVLLGLEFIVVPLGMALQAQAGAGAAVGMMVGEYGLMFGLRLALVFVGAGVLGIFLYQAAQKAGQERVMGNLAYLAFALVFVAEVLGRVIFYATTLKIGLQ